MLAKQRRQTRNRGALLDTDISPCNTCNLPIFTSRRTSMKCQSFPFAMIFATVSLCIILLFLPASIGLAAESGLDTARIESITGLKGVLNEKENSFKVSKPRNDVAITVDQARLAPFMGFTSWATFAPGTKDSVMVMGDMVLFEDEVNSVMSVALDKGLEVTALHNHFFFDEPKVYFMQIGGVRAADKYPDGGGRTVY